ncbi:DUF378 domain-containing protein [Sinorhizobium meliloti]|nr:DUF378 domain-containing protein [Sinorhizobium meliloti]
MKFINVFTLILLIVGGLNWGLVGLFSFDLVPRSLGLARGSPGSFTFLVGLSAAWQIVPLFYTMGSGNFAAGQKPIGLGRDRSSCFGPRSSPTIIVFHPGNAGGCLAACSLTFAWVSFAAALNMVDLAAQPLETNVAGAR